VWYLRYSGRALRYLVKTIKQLIILVYFIPRASSRHLGTKIAVILSLFVFCLGADF
jgi:hypothetical protein